MEWLPIDDVETAEVNLGNIPEWCVERGAPVMSDPIMEIENDE